MSKETKAAAFILILKPNGDENASLVNALTTVCVDVEDLKDTIIRAAMNDSDDVVDQNLNWIEEEEEIIAAIQELLDNVEEDPEDNVTTFDVGLNEDDDYVGLEVHIKKL